MTQTLGRVFLIGAGPGDADLITVRGQRLLSQVDAIVHDKLIDRRLLEFAPRAERYDVGKHPGKGCPNDQPSINALLVRLAREGKQIARLKGGDPLLFARGAEEGLALAEAGIPFEIVPGVTAALAAAATVGLPLTHRGISSAVAFVTGHEDPSKTPALDWTALARFPGTLVVYMALVRLPEIARRLIEAGKSAETPVVLVEWGGTNRQKVLERTLGTIDDPREMGLVSPMLAIIGEVGALRGQLDWHAQRPLVGQGVLLCRPRIGTESEATTEPCRAADSEGGSVAVDCGEERGDSALVDRLTGLGAEVHWQPALELRPNEAEEDWERAFQLLPNTDWIVWTSQPGVRIFLRKLHESGRDLRSLANCQLAAIGSATAKGLAEFHLRADLVPERYDSESLASALEPLVQGKRVLLARADRGRPILADRLARVAAEVRTLVVYHQFPITQPTPAIREALDRGTIQWVVLSSSNVAREVVGWLDEELKNKVRAGNIRLATISPVTSGTVRELGLPVAAEAMRYTLDGVVDAMISVTSPAPSRHTAK